MSASSTIPIVPQVPAGGQPAALTGPTAQASGGSHTPTMMELGSVVAMLRDSLARISEFQGPHGAVTGVIGGGSSSGWSSQGAASGVAGYALVPVEATRPEVEALGGGPSWSTYAGVPSSPPADAIGGGPSWSTVAVTNSPPNVVTAGPSWNTGISLGGPATITVGGTADETAAVAAAGAVVPATAISVPVAAPSTVQPAVTGGGAAMPAVDWMQLRGAVQPGGLIDQVTAGARPDLPGARSGGTWTWVQDAGGAAMMMHVHGAAAGNSAAVAQALQSGQLRPHIHPNGEIHLHDA